MASMMFSGTIAIFPYAPCECGIGGRLCLFFSDFGVVECVMGVFAE